MLLNRSSFGLEQSSSTDKLRYRFNELDRCSFSRSKIYRKRTELLAARWHSIFLFAGWHGKILGEISVDNSRYKSKCL
jgi:hypothetical protein